MAVITKTTLPVVDEFDAERRRRGLSYQAAADQLGVSKGTVRNWIKGNNPPEFTTDLQRGFAKFLGVSPLHVAELYGFDVSSEQLRPYRGVFLFSPDPPPNVVGPCGPYPCNGLRNFASSPNVAPVPPDNPSTSGAYRASTLA